MNEVLPTERSLLEHSELVISSIDMSVIQEHDNPKSESDNTPFEIAVSPSVSINQSKASDVEQKTPEDSLELIRRKILAEKEAQRKIDEQIDRI